MQPCTHLPVFLGMTSSLFIDWLTEFEIGFVKMVLEQHSSTLGVQVRPVQVHYLSYGKADRFLNKFKKIQIPEFLVFFYIAPA